MSAGRTVIAFYDPDGAGIYAGRVQPETLALTVEGAGGTVTNTSAAGPATRPSRFKVSKGRNQIGVGPRTVSFQWATPADAPAGYEPSATLTLPVMLSAFWDEVQLGSTGTYLGGNIQYISKSPESIR